MPNAYFVFYNGLEEPPEVRHMWCGSLSIVLRRQRNFAKAMRYINHDTENPVMIDKIMLCNTSQKEQHASEQSVSRVEIRS